MNSNGNIGSELLKKQGMINNCLKRSAVFKDIRDHTFMISNMEGG